MRTTTKSLRAVAGERLFEVTGSTAFVDAGTPWRLSDRFDPRALPLADAHYNRRTIGSPQFVPPGRCLVFLTRSANALWVTSWPFPQFVRHAWPGAWVNSLFRNESSAYLSSELIAQAVALTRATWEPPTNGIISFVDASKIRRKRDPGRCYRRAGWTHVGFTKGGLWAYQQLPREMPGPDFSLSQPLFAPPASIHAVDPSVPDPGTPTPRAAKSSSSSEFS